MRYQTSTEDGFSLLELLVAIAILSMAVIPMISTQTGALKSTSDLNERLLARIVAENALTELRLSEIPPAPGSINGTEYQAGMEFIWQAEVRNIPQQPLMAISLSVMKMDGRAPLFEINGFRKNR